MIAQYGTGVGYEVSIFRNRETTAIMNCVMLEDSIKEADLALKRCRLRRKTRWMKRREWGYEARVYWRARG